MARRAVLASMAAVLVVAGLVAPAASGAKPTFERIAVDVTFEEPFLTEACGFPVLLELKGQVIIRTFESDGAGLQEVVTVNLVATAMAGDNTFQRRDVGANVIRTTPSGDVILLVTGQVPLFFTGALKINLTTGEVILEPQHSTEAELAELCAALAA